MVKQTRKRILAILMTLAMVISIMPALTLPASAYAAPAPLAVIWTGGDQSATCHDFGDYITSVSFAGVTNNSSTAAGWHTDYGRTDPQIAVTEVQKGQTYPISVTVAGGNFSWHYLAVYIDWNGDGDNGDLSTMDAGEEVAVWNDYTGSGTTIKTANISVPTDAVTGCVYMRVMLDADSENPPMGDYTCGVGYGEFEDYVLNVSAGGPTMTDANISITGGTGTGGAFKIGDTVTATWNNTAGGDNNGNITSVTVDFSQFGGGAAVAATNSSGTWTATYTITAGDIDATGRNVSVTATDDASNSTTTADTTNATVDNIAPTVTDARISISGATGTGGAFKIGDTVTATWNNTAGGDNNSDTISAVTVDFSAFGGGAAVAATNSSGTWTAIYTITAGAIDATNRNVAVTATDNAGNATTTADTTNATLDNIAPTVTDGNISISGASGTGGAFKTGDTVTATWDNTAFGDNNSDTISSVTVDFSQFGGGAAVAATNSGGTWTATYTIVTGAIDATNRNVAVTATDNAGNVTTTADTSNATVDNIAPTVSISSTAGANTNTSPIPVTITFSESVTGFTVDDITVTNGAASNLSGSGTTYTADITPSGDGAVTVDVAANVAQDAAGNNNTAATQLSRTYDSTAPTVTITSAAPTHTNTSPISVTITFSESVTGFVIGDISVGNGTAGNFSGSGTTYTADITPSAQGAVTVDVAADVAQDAAGNNNTAATQLSRTYDTTPPTAPTVTSAAASTNNTTPEWTWIPGGGGNGTYRYRLDNNDLTSGATETATASYTPATGLSHGAHTLYVQERDDAGNWSASGSYAVTIDGTGPTATIVVSDTALKTGETSLVTFTFSEAVTGFTNDDLTIPNGTLTAVSSADSGITWTATFTPTAAIEDSTNVISLNMTGVFDLLGNSGSGNTNSNNYAIDTKRPTATISMSQSDFYSGETATVTITFSEAVTGFTNDDLTISNGTLTAVSSADGAITWTATFTAANVDAATNSIVLALTGITDAAGNSGSGTASSGNYSVSMPTVPGAPTGVTVTAGDTQASVSFTAPVSNGGASITGYTVTSSPGGYTGTGAGSPITVTGLTNGVAYTFTVTATNSAGTGAASAASNSVTPRAAQTITFNNPGAQNFGTSPTLTATSSSGLTVTFTSETPDVCTVTSGGLLSFITAGTATITAHQAGNGSYLPAAQVSQSFTVNPVVPGAPTNVTATAGDTQASVSFSAPVSTGGTSITGYTVTVSPADVAPVNGASSPITVTGLTNGQAYTFTVTATNSAGTGAASAASNSVTPRATQTITFNNPGAQNFGTSPTLTATSDSGLTVTFTSETPEVCTVTSGGVLTFISAGTATITANQAGDGSYLPAPSVSRTFTVNPVAPGAPTGVTATAGNAQASVSFSAPVSNGGASITSYTVTSSPGGFTATGAGSPITVTGLTNGVAYTFTVTATNGAGTGTASAASNSVTPQAPVYDNTQSTPFTNSAVVEVNGERQDAGTSATTTTDGQTVTTITVDGTKLDKILESSGENPTVTLPSTGSAVTVGELNGQTVKNMENKEATLEIKTDTVTYTLPASQINIDAVSALLGSQVELEDIKVSVRIAEPAADTVRIVEDTASKGGHQLVVKPIEFEITCTSGDQTVTVSKFNGYVERTIAIPDGIDPSKITTGIVLNADGTFTHVPTQIVVIDGKYYAKINSLTNSTYSVIWNPITFTDVANHWAKDAINDMGSRMVVTGIGNGLYAPERSITRAEFAAIIVRTLGLQKGSVESAFDDVTLTDWFNGYVDTATAYKLITGYDSANFGPNDIITREQAMTLIARAMKLTGLKVTLTESEVTALLSGYSDGEDLSVYARESAAACLKTGVITGTTATTISPKAPVSRAEVAVMVQRLLQKSGLI